jgi:hypothetical protein
VIKKRILAPFKEIITKGEQEANTGIFCLGNRPKSQVPRQKSARVRLWFAFEHFSFSGNNHQGRTGGESELFFAKKPGKNPRINGQTGKSHDFSQFPRQKRLVFAYGSPSNFSPFQGIFTKDE